MKTLVTVGLLVLVCANVLAQSFESFNPRYFPRGEFIADPNEFELPSYGVQKIVGKNNLEKLSTYPKNSEIYGLSRKIGFVYYLTGHVCSGSLVGPDLFLTNEHCAFIDDKQVPLNDVYFTFDYYGKDGDFEPAFRASAYGAIELVKYSKALDYALYRLNEPAGNKFGWLKIEPNDNLLNSVQNVKIIQHPQGRSKEIALQDSHIVKLEEFYSRGLIHYIADTEGGSSGSPVFTPDGDSIIALHHAGYNNKETGKGLINEGILASRLYAEIGQYLPTSEADRKTTPRQQQPVQDRASRPKPEPQRISCDGVGMVVEKENGEIECVKW